MRGLRAECCVKSWPEHLCCIVQKPAQATLLPLTTANMFALKCMSSMDHWDAACNSNMQ